jgi:hypothetical protein
VNASGEDRPPLRLRLAARCLKHRLDRELADGADPRSRPLLAARADALRGPREREAIAAAIYGLLKESRRSVSSFSVRAPIARHAVGQHRRELLEIAAELRYAATISPRGVACLRLLVTDGSSSPVYRDSAAASLGAAVSGARRWLDDGGDQAGFGS